MISGHGSDRHNYQQKVIADFSSNVWYKGPPKKLIKYLQNNIHNIVHYPEPNAESLSEKVAKKYHVNVSNVLVTNGATEAFYLVAQVFQEYSSYITYPAFAEYEDACKSFKHCLHFIRIDQLNKNKQFKPNSLFWLGNPNNPDGIITSKETIKTLCNNNSKTIFIIDEAYAELCDGSESVVSLLKEFNNLIIIHSLTKTFAVPGIRLGYILASEKIIKALTLVKMPWSVNYLALEAGSLILQHYNKFLPDKKKMCFKSKSFQKELNAIDGLRVRESNCNYFITQLKNGKAEDLKYFLMENHGLLIRDATNFRGLDTSCFRVSLQRVEHNKQLVNAISGWVNNS